MFVMLQVPRTEIIKRQIVKSAIGGASWKRSTTHEGAHAAFENATMREKHLKRKKEKEINKINKNKKIKQKNKLNINK